MAQEIVDGLDRAAALAAPRQFRLFDGMILIAGLALALGAGSHLLVLLTDMSVRLCRQAVVSRIYLPGQWPVFWSATRDPFRNVVWYGFQVAQMLMMGLTPAFLVLRFRSPRPSWRGLVRQPGTVAALSMVFGLFWGTGCLLGLFPDRFNSMNAAPSAIGLAVVLAWASLALSRRWVREPGWLDRLGRALGETAIGTALAGLVIPWI